jgi:hypothetical protein
MRIGEMIAPFGPGSETLGADTGPGPEGALRGAVAANGHG